MISMLQKPLATILFFVITGTLTAQKKQLTTEQYVKNNFKGITQNLPVFKNWSDDSHVIITINGKDSIIDCATGKSSMVNNAPFSSANTLEIATVYNKNNDLYIKQNGVEVQLTSDTSKEVNPTMSPDGNYVAFTKNNNLYSINISTKKITAITNDGSTVILNGYASWVYTEEILGRPSRYRSFWWSPDSKHIAFFRTDDSLVPEVTLTDANTTQHGYIEKVRYPKVGDANPQVRIGIASPETSNIVWADFNEKDDQYFGAPYWTMDGSALWVQWINRGQDDLKIWSVNPATGNKKQVYEEKQKTWVQLEDGYERLHFLNNNKNVIIESDKTGWNHLYLLDMNGKELNAITTGKFTVLTISKVDEKKGVVYFTARGRENTARTDFYRVDLSGKNLLRLSFGAYNHTTINLSPAASYFITTFSNSATPATMALVNNKGKIMRELGNVKAEEFDKYDLAKTELLRVKSDDSLFDLPMKVTWPVNMDKNKKYPVLISIYGGPNAGTCWDTWSLTGNQQWYAKEGLIQVVMDHRASGQFGKEGVNYMHRNLGYWEMKDYSTMVKWLIANGNADPKKICITGFSYGGYLSCYALTYGSDVFTHGMAGGSVTDWSFYDTHYTERYMDTPAENPEGYQSSSVLNYADKYKGMLQIVHGIIDDNVHLQNSIAFTSKLQDLKKDFEYMTYSGSRHGWPGNKWLHYQNMKTKFIYTYLLQKEMPAAILK
jgi:dipeptidyl-peptidase 4